MTLSLRRAVSEQLVGREFERSGRTLRRPLTAEFRLIVDTGPLGGGPDISPWVGLQYRAAVRIQSELLEVAFDDFVATVGANVGVLLQRGYLSWRSLGEVGDVLDTIDAGAHRIGEFAHPDRIASAFALPGFVSPDALSMVPIHLARADFVLVERWLAAGQLSECSEPGPLCEQFRRFERNARDRMARLGRVTFGDAD